MLATELRDSIEIVQTSEYGNFLLASFKAFSHVLSETQPKVLHPVRPVNPSVLAYSLLRKVKPRAHTSASLCAAERR